MTDERPPARRDASERGAARRGRRTDPLGKDSLFTAPVAAPRDQIATGEAREGRGALFSTGPQRAGTVLVSCRSCRATSRISLADLALRLATGSFWWPLRRSSHWMRCPSCERRSWCAVNWTG